MRSVLRRWERYLCFQWTNMPYHNALTMFFWTAVSCVGGVVPVVLDAAKKGTTLFDRDGALCAPTFEPAPNMP